MMGRRMAALLCVLLLHALALLGLLHERRPVDRERIVREPDIAPITWLEEPEHSPPPALAGSSDHALSRPRASKRKAAATVASTPAASQAPGGSSLALTPPGSVDWPLEGRKAAEREVQRELEAERLAKMFAGPGGTWASLTKRQRSQINKFRWKRSVEGLRYDEHGNAIYEMPNGCTLVNLLFIGCPIGFKPTVHGDMFDNMREYFDEQRMPETKDGNGTEPESIQKRD